MYLLDDAGSLVDSEFSLDVDSGTTCVVVESSGGANPGAGIERRNPDYNNLINILLRRIGSVGASITRIVLDSKLVVGVPIEDRIAVLDHGYPIHLTNVNFDELRRMIGRAVAGMHRAEGAKSRGNAQKRIRICFDRIFDPDVLIASGGETPPMELIEEYAPGLSDTEREYLRKARVGQGKFRKELLRKYESKCPVTGIGHPDLLVASHIKPWKACSNLERLDSENGILFSGLIDRLFDSGLITFNETGGVIISSRLTLTDVEKCRLNNLPRLSLSSSAQHYMAYHRVIEFHQ